MQINKINMKKEQLNVELLSDTEMVNIEGGGFFYDTLYSVGYAILYGATKFAKAQERDLQPSLGGPTANHG